MSEKNDLKSKPFKIKIIVAPAGESTQNQLDLIIETPDPALCVLLAGRIVDVLDQMEHMPVVEFLE